MIWICIIIGLASLFFAIMVIYRVFENMWAMKYGYDDIIKKKGGYRLVFKKSIGQMALFRRGSLIIPFSDDIENLHNDFYIVKKDGRFGVFDVKNKKFTVPMTYCKISYYDEICAICVDDDGKAGVVCYSGELVIPCEYEEDDLWGRPMDIKSAFAI